MTIRLIVGLGNPGADYAQTRHNAGFWFLDRLAQANTVRLVHENRFQALVARATIGGSDVWLMAPQTFMNRSGQPVAALANFYKIAAADMLVVHDELDLAPGVARLKKDGSSGGHNGLKDITATLGTQQYRRLRIGIGHPRALGLQQSVVDFVLHRPRKDEQCAIDEAIDRSLVVLPMLCSGNDAGAMLALHTQQPTQQRTQQ